jgi:hypothetical protein
VLAAAISIIVILGAAYGAFLLGRRILLGY